MRASAAVIGAALTPVILLACVGSGASETTAHRTANDRLAPDDPAEAAPLVSTFTAPVELTEPLVGPVLATQNDRGENISFVMIDRGVDRGAPLRGPRVGEPLDIESGAWDFTIAGAASLPISVVILVGPTDACETAIRRALEVQARSEVGGEGDEDRSPRRMILLVVEPCTDALMGVGGASVRLYPLDGDFSPVPDPLRATVDRIDRELRSEERAEARTAPAVLSLGPALRFVRGSFGARYLLQGDRMIWEDDLGNLEALALVEVGTSPSGARRFMLQDGPVMMLAVDLATRENLYP